MKRGSPPNESRVAQNNGTYTREQKGPILVLGSVEISFFFPFHCDAHRCWCLCVAGRKTYARYSRVKPLIFIFVLERESRVTCCFLTPPIRSVPNYYFRFFQNQFITTKFWIIFFWYVKIVYGILKILLQNYWSARKWPLSTKWWHLEYWNASLSNSYNWTESNKETFYAKKALKCIFPEIIIADPLYTPAISHISLRRRENF